MSIVDGDILRHTVDFCCLGTHHFLNTFTWRWDGNDHSEAGVVAALTGWAEDFYELMAAYLPSAFTGFTSYVDLIEWNATEEEWEVASNVGMGTGSVTFTDANDILPPQSAPCLVGVTARPKSRGRKFIPLFCEDCQNGGTINAGALADLGDALAEYVAPHIVETGKSLQPGIASTVTGTFLPFISSLLTGVIYSQIRRTLGRGG